MRSCLILPLLLLAPLPLLAQEEGDTMGATAAIVGVEADPVDQLLAESIKEKVAKALKMSREMAEMPKGPLRMQELRMLYDCTVASPECMSQVGQALAVDKLIYGTIEREGGRRELKLKLLDVKTSKVERSLSQEVPEGVTDRSLEVMAASFLGVVPTPEQGGIKVVSNVTGAEVYLNGKFCGVVPLEMMGISPGSYRLEVRSKEARWEGKVEVPQSGMAEVVAPLIKAEVVVPQGRMSPTAMAGWTSLGVGGASLVAGAILGWMTMNAQADYDETLYMRQSRDLMDKGQDYALATNVLLIAGGAVAAASVALLVFFDREIVEDAPQAPQGQGRLAWGWSF